MGKRALVTGACGFVGSHLIERLSEADWEVVGTDLEEARRETYYANRASAEDKLPEPKYYGDLIDDFDIEFVPADITQRSTLEPVFEYEYDVVFHTASLYDYFAEWEPLYAVNVEGGRNVGELAVENDVDHFVHWSTLGVCGGKDLSKSEPVQEDADYAPHNRYGKSKVEQEKTLLELHEREGLPITILRPAPIYGPRHNYGVYHLLYLYRKIGTGLVFPVFPAPRNLHFPCVHVEDIVRAALFVHDEREQTVGETYHVTSDLIRQDEFVTFVANSLGLPVKRCPLPWPIYRTIAGLLVEIAKRLEQRARSQNERPKFPASMAQYLKSDFWFTNQKLKDEGFEFVYEDPRRGLWQYITWCKERGML